MIDPNIVRAAVLEFRAVMGAPVVVHLNPSDAAGLDPQDREIILAGGGVSIRPDREVAEGSYSIGGK